MDTKELLEIASRLTPLDAQAVERELCKQDLPYFINDYVKIEDRDVEGIVIPFRLWDSQKPILETFLKERLVQIMKANQLGLTWLIIAYGTWRLINNAGYSVKAISETEIKAKEIIRRIDFILRHLPNWMIAKEKNDTLVWYEATVLTITFHHPPKNGKFQEDSVIQAFASSPTAGASFTANLFLFDEWALQEYAREIWTYAFPTINRPTGGQVIGISTIERGTLFEDIWRADNGFKKIFLGWFADPRRDQKWYDNTIKELGRDETLKHYPATPEEALAIPGGAFFGEFSSLVHIRNPLPEIPQWYIKYRVLDYGIDMLACYFIYIDDKGFARIYKEIHQPGLVISQAAYWVLKESNANVPMSIAKWDILSLKEKKEISKTGEKFYCTFAPPDLFSRESQTGRASSDIWLENGIVLTRTKNNLEEGCRALTEWLHPIVMQNEQTGDEYTTSRLTIDKDKKDPNKSCAPNLVRSLLNIQKDKQRPEVYANQPHNLTHSVSSMTYFCTEIMRTPVIAQQDTRPNFLKKYAKFKKKKFSKTKKFMAA